jgi:NADPH:quinone reductase-like Zn-dependent oxidoreductase
VPDALSTVEAASLPTTGMTAWQMIRRTEVESGDAVLVPGATGGIGVTAVQLLEAKGIDAVATSRSETKLKRLADLGATKTLVVESATDLSDALAGVETPAAALVHLGGDWVTESLDRVGRGGTVVVCGQTAGGPATVDIAGMYLGHKHVIGSSMGTQRDLKRVVKLAGDGRIEPPIAREYGFDEAREAFEALTDADLVGKIVLRP